MGYGPGWAGNKQVHLGISIWRGSLRLFIRVEEFGFGNPPGYPHRNFLSAEVLARDVTHYDRTSCHACVMECPPHRSFLSAEVRARDATHYDAMQSRVSSSHLPPGRE